MGFYLYISTQDFCCFSFFGLSLYSNFCCRKIPAFLRKPFSPEELAFLVRTLLSADVDRPGEPTQQP